MTEKTLEPFVMRPVALLVSSAHRALGIHARRILDCIEIEHCRHYRKRNGELQVSYNDFVGAGIGRRFIHGGLRDLQIVGLLEIRAGRCAPGQFRAPNLYRLTYLRTECGEPTNDYKKITSLKQAKLLLAKSAPKRPRPRPKRFLKLVRIAEHAS